MNDTETRTAVVGPLDQEVRPVRIFTAKGIFKTNGNAPIYLGDAPFPFERNKALQAFSGEWQISGLDGKTLKVIGVESHCVEHIKEGEPIGLMVKECKGPNTALSGPKPAD